MTPDQTNLVEAKEENFFIRLWNGVSDFLHRARLIPFIIAVSGYHYFQVLSTHDQWYSAIPVAVFLDLLHYRTVEQAIETKKTGWVFGAVFTTVIALAFQYLFYSGAGVTGELLKWYESLLFSLIVPIGIWFMVWHHHENAQKVEGTLQADLEEKTEELNDTQTLLSTVEAERDAAQKEREDAQKELANAQTRLSDAQNENDVAQQLLSDAQKELADTQSRLTDLQEIKVIWSALNEETQVLARVAAKQLSTNAALGIIDLSRATIDRRAKAMNGAGA